MTWLGETFKEVGRRRSYTVAGGFRTFITYEGTHEAIAAAAAQLTGVDFEEDYNTGTPAARLTISTPDAGDTPQPTDGVITSTFELVNNMAQKSGYEHKRSLALGSNACQAVRNHLRKVNPVITEVASGFSGNQFTLLEMMATSQDSFVQGQWTFKVSDVLRGGATALRLSMDNINALYTSASVIEETGAPGIYATAITNAHAAVTAYYGGSAPTGHTIGWLKTGFSINRISGNRDVVTAEYWLEAWRNYYYA